MEFYFSYSSSGIKTIGNFLRQYICIDNIACQRYSVPDEKSH
ncbi:hypothetical protein COXBURSA331_A2021 [Coxiella burnetii RSA 331]|nr:hypothetical protein COXBURSA331_A2021 [Coxiella burnetii RSA 331]EDR36736.1 hypothetical protein COXBURSA334_2102 [Coxiella burnetii Q321]MDE3401523.1 hypothetical protein [Coxiella burnetii]